MHMATTIKWLWLTLHSWAVLATHAVAADNAECADNAAAATQAAGCGRHLRLLGGSTPICPVFNGVWTSFLDHREWGGYHDRSRLSLRLPALLDEMDAYEADGFNVWVGEDFDLRVMALLGAHRERRSAAAVISVIIEAQTSVERGLRGFLAELGLARLAWAQLARLAIHCRAPGCKCSLNQSSPFLNIY